jgi:hypothetical protein
MATHMHLELQIKEQEVLVSTGGGEEARWGTWRLLLGVRQDSPNRLLTLSKSLIQSPPRPAPGEASQLSPRH